ncbi:MAG: GGDEF domain-containing protein [Gemmatimonadota bacterium]
MIAFAGAMTRELLAIREVAEAEELVARAVKEFGDAEWVAIYKPDHGRYRHTHTAGEPELGLPEQLDESTIQTLLSGDHRLRPCSGQDAFAPSGAVLCTAVASEFEFVPALLLIGPRLGGEYGQDLIEGIQALVDICGDALRNAELLERLRSQVFIDFVTGCYNRRAFDEHLSVELVRARRYERPLTLLLLDLDDFKEVNDTYGHPAGDYALQRVGDVLRDAFRTTDRVCRYGGDEFAVVFPETPKGDVLRLAERLRKQIGSIFPDALNPVRITASIGVAGYPLDAASPEDLVRAADRALYGAKSGGRDQVVPA